MSGSATHGPLVYASPRALEEAREVVPGAVIENLVERAILAGRLYRCGGSRAVVVGDTWEAACVRAPRDSDPTLTRWVIRRVSRRS